MNSSVMNFIDETVLELSKLSANVILNRYGPDFEIVYVTLAMFNTA